VGEPAARVTDMHTCPMMDGPKPHVGGPILPAGCPTVLIGNLPSARVTDMATCASAPDTIVQGAFTVLIDNLPAARMGDTTAHGGVISAGFMTVMIGDGGSPGVPPAMAFKQAARTAAALVCKGPCDACGKL
jgi:uncharacterized Zn-binding protein involved in type VI secretion